MDTRVSHLPARQSSFPTPFHDSHSPYTRLQHNVRCSSTSSASTSSLPRPRLNYRHIAENAAHQSHNATIRKAGVHPDTPQRVADLHKDTTELSRKVDELRAQRASVGATVRQAKSPTEKEAALAQAKHLKASIHSLEQALEAQQEDLYSLAYTLPNDTHPSTPIGPESAARVVSTHGPAPIPADPQRDHVRIATALDMLDMESAATVTGSSWYYLRNEGALLELALTNYAMSKALSAGFTPVTVPDVVKADIAHRCGFQPRDEASSQNYYLDHGAKSGAERLVLAGTAEIPLAGMFAQRVVKEKDLPLLVAGLGRAFRAEAGARGADTRGLYRVHQFTKVELFAVTSQQESDAMIERMIALQQSIFDGLNIPYK